MREEGRQTRVLDKTFLSLGKSDIPESRMLIEESSNERELRREVTDAVREVRDWDCVYAIVVDGRFGRRVVVGNCVEWWMVVECLAGLMLLSRWHQCQY